MKKKLTARSASVRQVRAIEDERLPAIAKQAWAYAERICEPTRLVAKDRGDVRVLGCEEDIRSVQSVTEARQVIDLLLDRKRPNGSKADQTRNWAIWRMMTLLLERSVRESESGETVFPYPNPNAAATAVVAGFEAAGLDSRLTKDRVLANYKRHFRNR